MVHADLGSNHSLSKKVLSPTSPPPPSSQAGMRAQRTNRWEGSAAKLDIWLPLMRNMVPNMAAKRSSYCQMHPEGKLT